MSYQDCLDQTVALQTLITVSPEEDGVRSSHPGADPMETSARRLRRSIREIHNVRGSLALDRTRARTLRRDRWWRGELTHTERCAVCGLGDRAWHHASCDRPIPPTPSVCRAWSATIGRM